jgi:hypothetical protein
MKRTRKLTIEIEQKEITMTFNLRGNAHGDIPCVSSTSKTNKVKGDQGIPDSCPSCGLTGMLPIAAALTSYRDGKYALARALNSGAIHICRSGRGLWLCQNSLASSLAKLPLDSTDKGQ